MASQKLKVLSILVIVVMALSALPLYFWEQNRYSLVAKDRVYQLLQDKSSTLSRAMVTRVGDYDSVEIEGTYPHIHWHRVMVDGFLAVGQKRYWFRVIDRDGIVKIEAVMEHE